MFELSVFLVMESSSYRGEDFELKVVFDLWRRNVGRIRITDRQVSLSYRGEMLAKFELHRRNLSSSSYREEMLSEFELPTELIILVFCCSSYPRQFCSCSSYGEWTCLLYTSPSPRDRTRSRMPSSA